MNLAVIFSYARLPLTKPIDESKLGSKLPKYMIQAGQYTVIVFHFVRIDTTPFYFPMIKLGVMNRSRSIQS